MEQVKRKNITEKYGESAGEPMFTLLLDMNSIMKTSLVDGRLGGNGKSYGMVFQTLLAITNQLRKKRYNYVYAMYDGDNSGQLRYNLYKDYKVNRDKNYKNSEQTDYDKAIDAYCKKVLAYSRAKRSKEPPKVGGETEDETFQRQRDILFAVLDELFVRQVICDDVEGDDLIASYVKNKKPNEKIVIVSGDRDLTQLISDEVCVYIIQKKVYVSPMNHVKLLGYTHENVLLKKIFCGDSSDAIKGIKGLGETTFFNMFPKAVTEKMTVDEVIEETKRLIDERKAAKKKPTKVMENIVNRVTDGCHGKDIYEVNAKIIDLSEPMLTEDARDLMNIVSYAPIDPEGREIGNVYNIILENKMTELMPYYKFTAFFAPFNALIDMEKRFFNKKS